jgi:hypothetical protein
VFSERVKEENEALSKITCPFCLVVKGDFLGQNESHIFLSFPVCSSPIETLPHLSTPSTHTLSAPQNKSMHTHINSNIAQLRPAHRMVQVVLAKVVLGQVGDVGELHVRNVRRAEWTNIHFWSCGVSCAGGVSLLFLFPKFPDLELVLVMLG